MISAIALKDCENGDLIVTCVVEDNKDGYFHRDSADVHVEIPISVTQAILGGTVDVRTLTGIVDMEIFSNGVAWIG